MQDRRNVLVGFRRPFFHVGIIAGLSVILSVLGCDSGASLETPESQKSPVSGRLTKKPTVSPPKRENRVSVSESVANQKKTRSTQTDRAAPASLESSRPSDRPTEKTVNRRSLAELLQGSVDAPGGPVEGFAQPTPDLAQTEAAGIRRLEGDRVTIYTNIPSNPTVDALPELFDQAWPQWNEYFGLEPEKGPKKLLGVLMKDRRSRPTFEKLGLLPDGVPDFPHAYCLNDTFWAYDQPSEYYLRHLVLHEGVHAFMNRRLGGCGPPWYMEGMAELLSTHRWDGGNSKEGGKGRLAVNYFPRDRSETPMWGRVKMIQDAESEGQFKTAEEILAIRPEDFAVNRSYGWAWAFATLLERSPDYRERFRTLHEHVLDPTFNQRFRALFADDWDRLAAEWRVLVGTMEYGHDLEQTGLDLTPGRPIEGEKVRKVEIWADQGWQNSGIALQGGNSYQVGATGRFQIAAGPPEWVAEPGGVSIRYYKGVPLGKLLAAVVPDGIPQKKGETLLKPIPIGLSGVISPPESGTLFLKVNDSPAELFDNRGTITVEIRPEKVKKR